MSFYKLILALIGGLFLFAVSSMATPISESKLRVESGKMLFTLKKVSSSGYDPTMVESDTMTGIANDVYGKVDMKSKTFNVLMDIDLLSFSLGGKFKFANPRMHETHLESSQFPSARYAGNIVSYNTTSGKTKLNGKMTVHGVTKENFEVEGLITPSKSKSGYLLTAEFDVNLNDFNITIPNTQITKISEIVKLKLKIELRK